MPLPKKPKKGAPGWMTSFADLQQLLLVFFILLFSMSSVDEDKFSAMADSMQMGFDSNGMGFLDSGTGAVGEGVGSDKTGDKVTSTAKKKEAQLKEELKNTEKFLNESEVDGTKLSEHISAVKTDEGIILRIDDVLLFDSGSAEMKNNSKEILKELGKYIKESKSSVRVEGHTDNVPTSGVKYASNWELSTSRATTVVQFLLSNKFINPEKVAVAGYGEYRPIAPNDTPANKSKNRRVDIVLLSDFSKIEK